MVLEPDSRPGRRARGYCYHNGVADSANSSLLRVLHTVFLDRDGVLNEKMPEGRYVTSWSEFQLLPGVVQAIALLNRAGLRVVVISNQRGVALGLYAAEDVRAIHAEFQKMLEAFGAHVDGFYFCPHDKGQCNCRKPLPGLFEQAVAEFLGITAASSVMIGDSIADIEFGRRLGMVTVFIDGDPERQKPGVEAARELADLRFSSLYEAVNDLLARLAARGRSSSTICLGFPPEPR
jgi:D-glycero-D-manno-heptose 1,7-bisphosphate phosphatase